ncbi:SET domain-containing protein [Thiolapillus sp.]
MSSSEKRLSNRALREWVYSSTSPIHGTGLFANKDIAAGQYIGTYHGPKATRNGMYVLWVCEAEDGEGEWIGCSGRNLLRYLNHAADCNAEFDGLDLYAVKDIAKDEEITFYYGDEFHAAI